MKVVGVIPARFASTRFPGKPLAKIKGKPMLQWVVEAAKQCPLLEKVIVATDDRRIENLCRAISVEVVMTDPDLPSGSDRVWAVAEKLDADVVINIQGDEPLLDPQTLSALINPFLRDKKLEMATLAHVCSAEDLENKNVAKVIVDRNHQAIYFSRFGIPFSRLAASKEVDPNVVLRHIGLYAFRADFLGSYCRSGPCGIELAEGLEQLRALHLGARIQVVPVVVESTGVDTPEDLIKVEAMIDARIGRAGKL